MTIIKTDLFDKKRLEALEARDEKEKAANKMLADHEQSLFLRIYSFGDDVNVIKNFYKTNPDWLNEEIIEDLAMIQRDLTNLVIYLNEFNNK